MKIEFVPADEEHARAVAKNMRAADREEAWAGAGLTPLEALMGPIQSPWPVTTLLLDGRPTALFGVGQQGLIDTVGFPWMLGTDALAANARRLLPMSRKWVQQKRQEYDLLTNFVDARNKSAVKWLKWLGFSVLPPEPYGRLRLPFHRFELRGF